MEDIDGNPNESDQGSANEKGTGDPVNTVEWNTVHGIVG